MKIDLERLSVLVVDDSYFVRSLVLNCLQMIGVGVVRGVEDGGAAIEAITKTYKDQARQGGLAIDMVISNWDMSPVDGPMLMRWIRRHKDSPERFMPVLMLTAYTEPARVAESRDLGVNELMAKPFTIQTLSDKIINVIQRNRQFVHTGSYFGPDRRRQNLGWDGTERRVLTDKSPEVEVLHV